MTPAARVQAAIDILDAILAGRPAELALTRWARASRFAGSKDRVAVRDHVFDALRCRRSFAALGGSETGRGLMLGAVRAAGTPVSDLFDGSQYGPAPERPDEVGRSPERGAEAGDIPDWVWPEFTRSLGAQSDAAAAYLRLRAPVFVRVNPVRASLSDVRQRLAGEGIETRASSLVETALEVTAGARRLRSSGAFSDGWFEFQDAASQAVVQALPLTSGMRVLDFCAGGGGKSLAMAARAGLDITAHDADAGRMTDLPERARRAGLAVQIAQTKALARVPPFDLVLCDVPCSGSGSWRRAPDGKWALTPQRLADVRQTQAAILDQVAPLVADQGVLAYVTCSVLACENDDQIDRFCEAHREWRRMDVQHWPLSGGADGFFLATLTRV